MRSQLAAVMTTLALFGCGSHETSTPASTPIAPTSMSASAAPATAPAPRAAPPIVFGEVVDMGEGAFVMLPQPDHARPEGPVIGEIDLHNGHWALREVETQTTPYTSIALVSASSACTGRVTRTRLLHAVGREEPWIEGPDEEMTFLAVEWAGCPPHAFGILGTSVVHHALTPESLPAARPELAALIEDADAAYVDESGMQGGVVRAFELPERNVAVVFGHGRWLVRGSRFVDDDPTAIIEAGALTFVISATVDSDVLHPIDDDPRLNATATCTVHDDSGTPLNVRATPSSRADVVGTLANGSDVRIVETRGAWRRIEAPSGWVFGAALQCL